MSRMRFQTHGFSIGKGELGRNLLCTKSSLINSGVYPVSSNSEGCVFFVDTWVGIRVSKDTDVFYRHFFLRLFLQAANIIPQYQSRVDSLLKVKLPTSWGPNWVLFNVIVVCGWPCCDDIIDLPSMNCID